LKAQSLIIPLDSAKNNSLIFIKYFPENADLILAYSEESYWWSNTENFKLLAFANNQWNAWTYSRKWKNSSDVYENHGQKSKKYFHKRRTIDSV
jgi:hypothetical protein